MTNPTTEGIEVAEEPVEALVARAIPDMEDEADVAPAMQMAKVLTLKNVTQIKASWEKLGEGFYLIRHAQALRQACRDFSAGEFEQCLSAPEDFPSLVVFSYEYGKRMVVMAKALPLEEVKGRINAFK
jgi:hypothetical protein